MNFENSDNDSDPMMEWIGLIGVIAFALAWIPQSLETIRAGRCDVNLAFLLLATLGSCSLMVYAFLKGDLVFSVVNCMTTVGALINLVYKLFPRSVHISPTSQ